MGLGYTRWPSHAPCRTTVWREASSVTSSSGIASARRRRRLTTSPRRVVRGAVTPAPSFTRRRARRPRGRRAGDPKHLAYARDAARESSNPARTRSRQEAPTPSATDALNGMIALIRRRVELRRRDLQNLLTFPNPMAGRRFGNLSTIVMPVFPNRRRAIRFGKLSMSSEGSPAPVSAPSLVPGSRTLPSDRPLSNTHALTQHPRRHPTPTPSRNTGASGRSAGIAPAEPSRSPDLKRPISG